MMITLKVWNPKMSCDLSAVNRSQYFVCRLLFVCRGFKLVCFFTQNTKYMRAKVFSFSIATFKPSPLLWARTMKKSDHQSKLCLSACCFSNWRLKYIDVIVMSSIFLCRRTPLCLICWTQLIAGNEHTHNINKHYRTFSHCKWRKTW
jgi:hypothetical protein